MSNYSLGNSGSLPLTPNVEFLKGNDGISVGPDPATHILNLVGNTTQGVSVSGNAGTFTETITVANATTGQIGVVSLATNAETIAGSVTTKATTPDDIKAKLGTQTLNGIAYGGGVSAAVNWTATVNNGVLITSNTGVPSLLANSLTPGFVLTANSGAPASWQAPVYVGMTWLDESGGSTNAVKSHGYFLSNFAQIVLPAVASQGDTIGFIVTDANPVLIFPNVGQYITIGVNQSSLGTGGPGIGAGQCENSFEGDSIEFVYQAASSTWYCFTSPTGVWNLS